MYKPYMKLFQWMVYLELLYKEANNANANNNDDATAWLHMLSWSFGQTGQKWKLKMMTSTQNHSLCSVCMF